MEVLNPKGFNSMAKSEALCPEILSLVMRRPKAQKTTCDPPKPQAMNHQLGDLLNYALNLDPKPY